MKANLTMPHPAFEGTFHPFSVGHDFSAFANRIAAMVGRGFKKLVEVLRPVSFEEAYLAQSQNHADLERRLFELSGGGYESSRRYFH